MINANIYNLLQKIIDGMINSFPENKKVSKSFSVLMITLPAKRLRNKNAAVRIVKTEGNKYLNFMG